MILVPQLVASGATGLGAMSSTQNRTIFALTAQMSRPPDGNQPATLSSPTYPQAPFLHSGVIKHAPFHASPSTRICPINHHRPSRRSLACFGNGSASTRSGYGVSSRAAVAARFKAVLIWSTVGQVITARRVE
jgi:hypothetical protein